MNRLKMIVYAMVVIGALGSLFTSGQLQYVFEQLLVLLVIFLLVVWFVPQFIVGEEKKPTQEPKTGSSLRL
jgi:flagellar biogenesis protein FliO